MLTKVTIYGERCSGTNYLEQLIDLNFDVNLTWEYGWKHFFGFQDDKLQNSDDTLFICIVRNLPDWINSFFRELHHLPLQLNTTMSKKQKLQVFLNEEIASFDNTVKPPVEIMQDRNIYTGLRYTNIYELRHTKLKWMLEDLPKKVNHCILIRYEDLVHNFNHTMSMLQAKGLKIKEKISFPINTNSYKKSTTQVFKKKVNYIPTNFILSNPHLKTTYEQQLYPQL